MKSVIRVSRVEEGISKFGFHKKENKMAITSRAGWLARFFFVLNVIIIMVLAGTFIVLAESPIYIVFGDSIGTVVEEALKGAGLYLPAPLGFLDIIYGSVLKRRSINTGKISPSTGIQIGIVGILWNLFWMYLLNMN